MDGYGKGIIYKAINKINGKIYVGKTAQLLYRRKICHNSNAFNKNCDNYDCKFYRAIRKYGKDNFNWDIIEDQVKIQDLNDLEKLFIKKLESRAKGYNSTDGGDGSFGYKHTEESKRKMSESSKGHIVSEETRQKLSRMRKGKKKTKEHVEKIRQANIGKTAGSKHCFYGKKRSKETIEKIKKTKRQSFFKPVVVFNVLDKFIGEWNSVAECVECLNLQQPNVWKCLNNERKSHKGYTFKYKETNEKSI